jgi:uncharacterized cupredoxin-like copper-binding protein
MSKTILGRALAALIWLALPLGAAADSGHGHKEESSGGSSNPDHGVSHGTHRQETAKPAGAADTWAALVTARDAIASDVESGTLATVHENSEPLPKLAASLLEQSKDLEAGKRARIEGAVKQVARVADALHDAADRGDAARTRKELSSLDGLLHLIRAQYPPGALDASSHGHEGHSMDPSHSHGAHTHAERPAGVVDALPQATVHIDALDPFRFAPTRLEVRAGVPTRIELVNKGTAEHSLVVKTPDGARDWVHLHVAPGATEGATYRLDEAGTYRVLCTIPGHTEGGMVGELVVLAEHGVSPMHP